jgi:hypothetical protein
MQIAYRLPWTAITQPGGRDCRLTHYHPYDTQNWDNEAYQFSLNSSWVCPYVSDKFVISLPLRALSENAIHERDATV